MKKYSIIFVMIIALVVSAASATAINSIKVKNLTGTDFTINNLKTINITALINNTNATNTLIVSLPSQLNFTAAGTSKLLSPSYNTSTSISVPNKTSRQVKLSLTADPLQIKAGNYTGLFNASSGSNSGTFNIKLNIPSKNNFTTTTSSLSAIQGNSARGSFNLANTGNTNLVLTLGATSLRSGSNTISSSNIIFPSSAALVFQQSKPVNITVNVPSNTPLGTYTGNITLTQGSLTKNSQIQVIVSQAIKDITIDNAIASWKNTVSTQNITYFTVRNTGNTNVTVSLAGNLKNSTLSFSPQTFTLAPGTNNNVRLTLTNVNLAIGTYVGKINASFNNTVKSSTLTMTVVNPSASILLPSSIQLGGTGQNRNQTASTTFTITNNGDFTVSNIRLTSNTGSSFNAQFSPNLITALASGASTDIVVSANVPDSKNSRNERIGDMLVNANGMSQRTIQMNMQARNEISISDMDVVVDGKSDDVNNGDTVNEDATPGSDVEIKIEIENLFSNSDDIDFEDIDLEITVEDYDQDGGDLELDRNFDLRADRTTSEKFSFSTPLDIDDGKHKVTVTVEGRDDNGAVHTDSATFNIKVVRDSHDIRIASSEFSPSRVSCDRSTNLQVAVRNLGFRDEDKVLLTVENSELGINMQDTMALQEFNSRDDEETRNFRVVIPTSSSSGSYKFVVKTFYGTEKIITDIKDVNLEVAACSSGSTTPTQGTTEPTRPSPTTPGNSNNEPGNIVTAPSGNNYAQPVQQIPPQTYLITLIAVTAVLSLAIVGIIFKMLFVK